MDSLSLRATNTISLPPPLPPPLPDEKTSDESHDPHRQQQDIFISRINATSLPEPAPPFTLPPTTLDPIPKLPSPLLLSPSPSSPYRTLLPLRAPPTPHPWIWKCHRCRSIFRLSCTTRCLECSHRLCLTNFERPTANTNRPNHSSGRTQRRNRRCETEFDFDGWTLYGSWRRRHIGRDRLWRLRTLLGSDALARLGNEEYTEQSGDEDASSTSSTYSETNPYPPSSPSHQHQTFPFPEHERKYLLATGLSDCSLHCDYPSECRREQYYALRRTYFSDPATVENDEKHALNPTSSLQKGERGIEDTPKKNIFGELRVEGNASPSLILDAFDPFKFVGGALFAGDALGDVGGEESCVEEEEGSEDEDSAMEEDEEDEEEEEEEGSSEDMDLDSKGEDFHFEDWVIDSYF